MEAALPTLSRLVQPIDVAFELGFCAETLDATVKNSVPDAASARSYLVGQVEQMVAQFSKKLAQSIPALADAVPADFPRRLALHRRQGANGLWFAPREAVVAPELQLAGIDILDGALIGIALTQQGLQALLDAIWFFLRQPSAHFRPNEQGFPDPNGKIELVGSKPELDAPDTTKVTITGLYHKPGIPDVPFAATYTDRSGIGGGVVTAASSSSLDLDLTAVRALEAAGFLFGDPFVGIGLVEGIESELREALASAKLPAVSPAR